MVRTDIIEGRKKKDFEKKNALLDAVNAQKGMCKQEVLLATLCIIHDFVCTSVLFTENLAVKPACLPQGSFLFRRWLIKNQPRAFSGAKWRGIFVLPEINK